MDSEWHLNGFTNLKKLNCSFNNIKGIPFGDIPNIEEIDSSHNWGWEKWAEPDFVSPKLKKLNLSHNSDIKNIDAFGVPQLTHLDVSNNVLLTRLDLRKNGNLQLVDCSGDSPLDLIFPSSASLENIGCQSVVSATPKNGLTTDQIIGIVFGIVGFIGVVVAIIDCLDDKHGIRNVIKKPFKKIFRCDKLTTISSSRNPTNEDDPGRGSSSAVVNNS